MLNPQKIPQKLSRYELQKALNYRQTTFLALDTVENQFVVIKLWKYKSGLTWKELELLKREAEYLTNLDHPALPKGIDSFEFENGYATVQTYVNAVSLQEQIEQGRIFSQEDIRELARQLLEVLTYIHKQNPPLIHRGISPKNILVQYQSSNGIVRVFLVGFNLAKSFSDSDPKYRTIVAESNYTSPEQLEGEAVKSSDLYSVAASLLFASTGKNHTNFSLRNLNYILDDIPHLGHHEKVWFKTMLNPHPDKRYKTAEIALSKLEQVKEVVSDPISPINLPSNSKLKITKNSNELKVLLDKSTILGSLINNVVILFFVSMFFPQIWLVFTHYFSAAALICLLSVWIAMKGTSKKELKINSHELTLNKFVFKSRKTSQLSIPLEDITQLQVTQPHWSEDSEGGISKYPPNIIIRTGIKEYTLPTKNLSKPEIDWIAYEMSQWLDIPIDREKIPVYKS